ncbi:hypothetical protein ACI2JA_17025 [Alkalihalobacillus sp. NPDC078783]
MSSHTHPLMSFFEGYVRNFRRLNLSSLHNRSMFTIREIDYFACLGEWLGFDAYVVDSKRNDLTGRSRPMDLSWWKWDTRFDKENYISLSLHLERESLPQKAEDTIEKLFTESAEGYHPEHVIGIQYVDSLADIDQLNDKILTLNKYQKSQVLMIYREFDRKSQFERIKAFEGNSEGWIETRNAVALLDPSYYWYMCFEEEWEGKQ